MSGWPTLAGRTAWCRPKPLVAVKAPVFSTAKLRGVDPLLGPAMQSTGEVIGLHRDPLVAIAKALVAAGLAPMRPSEERGSLALLSLSNEDKEALPELAASLASAGYRFCATAGTALALERLGYQAESLARVGEEATGGASVGPRRDRIRRSAAGDQHPIAGLRTGR